MYIPKFTFIYTCHAVYLKKTTTSTGLYIYIYINQMYIYTVYMG